MTAHGQDEANVGHNIAREWVTGRLKELGTDAATVLSEKGGEAPVFPTHTGEHQDPVANLPKAFFADVEVHLPKTWSEEQVESLADQIVSDQELDRQLGGRAGSSRLRRDDVKITQEDSYDRGRDAWRIRFPFVVHDPGTPGTE